MFGDEKPGARRDGYPVADPISNISERERIRELEYQLRQLGSKGESILGGVGEAAQSISSARPPFGHEFNREVVAYHQPGPVDVERITRIRMATLHLLDEIDLCCPVSADATAAKRHAREAMMTANAAIVLGGMV